MSQITDYATLQTAIAEWLNRSDLTDHIPTFIQLAEGELVHDVRMRKLQDRGTFVVSGVTADLPDDFAGVEDWYHDGPNYYGPILVAGAAQLSVIRGQHGPTGAPTHAAIVGSKAYFAPTPDSSYSTKMTYWRKLVALSAAVSSNWLLDEYPLIYLYESLMAAAPYLHDDSRVAGWAALLQAAKDKFIHSTKAAQFSGSMSRRPRRAIGG